VIFRSGGSNLTVIVKVVIVLAWISVHDHVVGGKLRSLAKAIGCSQKEALGILVSLWLWGLNNADRTGKLKSCERSDIAEELSKGLSDGLNPSNIVASLIEQKWIDEDPDKILYLHDWDSWQEQWYKFLRTKEYDAKRKREARAREREETQEPELLFPKYVPVSEDIPIENPVESPPDKPKKPKKAIKKEPEKKQYADYVSLKEAEYSKLISGYGEKATERFIEELNLYKGSTGKTYKSDYMTILNWVVEKVEKKYPGLIQRLKPEPEVESMAQKDSNPFGQWKE